MKKVLKNRKFYMFTAVFLSLFGLLAYFISAAFMNKGSVQFKAYTGYYESNQYPITDIVDQDGESYYSISKFYSWDNSKTPEKWTVTANPSEFDSSKYIGIDNITELVAFSRLCNPDLNPGSYTSFLGYSYILTNNIKSTGASTYFIPVGTDTPFSGVFNGNGYDITNLSFLNIQYSGEEDRFKTAFPKTQAHIEYYSMFAENSGTIENFGLINANMAFNYASTGQFDKVAMICGKNTGTISQVYVRDLRDAANNRSGIMPFGGYSIAGLVFTNSGTVKNCYTAYNSVVNGTVDDYLDFAELIYEGSSGTNLFFFNESISKIGPSTEYTTAQNYDGKTMDISYSSLGYSATRKVYGSYCQTLPILNTAVLATNSDDDTVQPGDDDYVRWYVASESKYGVDIATDLAVVMETPILRGLEFNDGVFSVKNVKDYAFMYEMFNANAALVGSEYKYQIENNIVLSSLDSSRYYYKGAIAATITGKKGSYSISINNETIKPVTINGEVAGYPTIFYPDYVNTYVTVEGFNAFGLFPYVTGEISNLNVVATKKATNEKPYSDLNIYVNNGNISTFGIVSGYIDSGRINNVNVYGAINFKGAAKAFVGGAVGTLTGNATVENVTTSGQLKLSTTKYTNSGEGNIEQNGFMLGNTIAGGVGYITNVSANLNGILNTMNLATSGVSTSFDLVVGGVLGAGYTTVCENLQNEGTITVGTGSETANQAKYNNLYVAGVIGRHLGQVDQSNGMTNYGTVTVYNNATYPAYVCGTVNVTPITANSDLYLLSNIYKTNGKYYYRASKIINGANVTISATGEKAHYVDTINVITNQCITRLSGVYNLAYSKSRKAASQTALGAKTISMNTFDNYAPVINYECNTSSNAYDEAVLQTVYNLRDISFTMSADLSKSLHYAGVAKGTKIQLTDVRNEGNLTFTVNKKITGDLFVSGIIEEISANSKAASLYNGGDIDVTYTAQITGNVWLSGICYKNNNGFSSTKINNYNPNLDSFDANALGSIDAAINAGNITLTNTNYASGITYNRVTRTSNNSDQYLAYFYNPSYSGSYIKGNINVAGITNINYSVITNSFNIGNIFTANVCKDSGYKINASGITDLNIGQYAYILNSANNGDIKAINIFNRTNTNTYSNSTLVRTDLTVAGIIARNDLTDSLTNYASNNGHSKQIVAFTINYGAIYAYNYNENIEGSNQEPNCKAAGIIGMGLLNVVNVLNYGNIFGSETISGIFGVVYFARFESEVNASNIVKIANTINYGNTFILYKGYNEGTRVTQAKANGANDFNHIEYLLFKTMDLNNEISVDGEPTYAISYSNFDPSIQYYTKSEISDINENNFSDYLEEYGTIVNTYGGIATEYNEWAKPYYKLIKANVNSNTYTTGNYYYISNGVSRNQYAAYSVSREVNNMSVNGSIFSIINFNNSDNARYVTIRYLINFEENAPLVGFEPATKDSVIVDRSTIYSAYYHLDTRNNGSGQMVRDTYMAYVNENNTNYVVYSPLTDETNATEVFVKSNSIMNVYSASDVTTETVTYNGVFSKNFDFYKAINKQYTKAEITANPTDAFLSDFFQFVEYSYINEALVDKIGWKEIAYAEAANTFARSTAKINTLLTKMDSDNKSYSSYTTYALANTSLWTKWSNKDTLKEIINSLIVDYNANDSNQKLESMLEYIFSSSSKSNVLITEELRENLYDIIVTTLGEEVVKSVFTNILSYENGYSKALADAVLDSDTNVYEFIENYISQLDVDVIKNILFDYIRILSDNTTTTYFNYGTNVEVRYDILNTMFENINDTLFYKALCDILDISETSSIDEKLKMYQGYETLDNSAKFDLFIRIINNNNYSNVDTYLTTMEGEIGFYARLVETGYNTVNLTDTYNNQIKTSDTTNEDETVKTERVALWNKIRNTSTFKSYFNLIMTSGSYYFLATEHRNTYQSNTAPSQNGGTDGDLSYYYTTVVTPSTYFYGPFSYASEDGKNLLDSVNGSVVSVADASTKIYKSDGTSFNINIPSNTEVLYPSSSNEHSGVWPVFIGDNLTYFNSYYKKVNKSSGTEAETNIYNNYTAVNPGVYTELGTKYITGVRDAALYLYEYGFTGANNQYCSGSTVDAFYYKGTNQYGQSTTDFGGSKLKTSNAELIIGTTHINLSDAAISAHYEKNASGGSFEIVDANGNNYLINGEFSIYDPDLETDREESGFYVETNKPTITAETKGYTLSYPNAGDDVWGDVLIRYGRNYYFAFVDETYHSTKRTGIYRYKSGQYSKSGTYESRLSWFTQKPNDGNNITWTTQYIDYSADQLLKLDGVFTNFPDKQSDDERNIINAIFNYYLCTSENRSNFEKVVRKALLESLIYEANATYDNLNASWTWNYALGSATRGNVTAQIRSNYNINNVNNTNSQTNWYNTSSSINGTITINGYYYQGGRDTHQGTVNYTINITDIAFNINQELTNLNIAVTSDRRNNIQTNWSYNNGILTLEVVDYYVATNFTTYYNSFSVPITLTTSKTTPNITANGYTIENSGSNYYIKSGETIIATLINSNGLISYSLNNDDYFFTNTSISNATNTFSTNYILQSKINFDYINQFIIANINSNSTISDSDPFTYLRYSDTLTVKQYLLSLVNNSSVDYKSLLIMNSIGDEDTYYKLIKKLLELPVAASNAELAEFTTMKVDFNNKKAVKVNTPTSYYDTDSSSTVSYEYGIEFEETPVAITPIASYIPGSIYVVSKPKTGNSGTYVYNITGTREGYGTLSLKDSTTVNVTTTQKDTFIIYTRYGANNLVNESNYMYFRVRVGNDYIVPDHYYDKNSYTYYLDPEDWDVKLNITSVNNVTFYELSQLSNKTEATVQYTYHGYYYFTDSIYDNATTGRFTNDCNGDWGFNPIMKSTYHLYDDTELATKVTANAPTQSEDILKEIKKEWANIKDDTSYSYRSNSTTIDKVEIEVVLKDQSKENVGRLSAIYVTDDGVRVGTSDGAMAITDERIIMKSGKSSSDGFFIRTRLGNSNYKNPNGMYVGSFGDYVIGDYSIISLMPNYTVTMDNANEYHRLSYFNNLDEFETNNDITLTKTTNPKDSQVNDDGLIGAYWMPNDAENSFSYDATSITGKYINSAMFDVEKNKGYRYNQPHGITNVMYKVSYSFTFDVVVLANQVHSMYDYDFGTGEEGDYNPTVEQYLGGMFNGTNANAHKTDYNKILSNLLPYQTSYYIGSSDVASLLATYNEGNTNLTTINSLFLEYLSNNPIDEYSIENFYKYFIISSNDSFIKFLQQIYSKNPTNIKTMYKLLLEKMLDEEGGYLYIADYIYKYNSSGLNYANKLITAAYISSDYENLYQQSVSSGNDALLYSSKIRLLLEFNSKYQYINSDGTFDNDKFDALLEYIGLGGNNDVYGIYALASSQGIKNGDFIPDNLNLSSHDAYYKRDKIDNVDNWVLIPETSTDYANWRLYGETDSTKYADEYPNSNNSTAKSDSVNYAFYVDMKQLKKSIATTLFEFDLSTNINGVQVSAYTMYSSQDLINEVTKTHDATEKSHYSIIYYVPTIYLKDIVENNDTLKVDEIIISSKAHAYKGEFTDKNIDVSKEIVKNSTTYNGGSFVLATNTMNSNYNQLAGCYVYENALTIFAEDTRVYSYFDILLKPIDFSFDMEYQKTNKAGTSTETTNYDTFGLEESTVPALNGIVSLKITSPIYVASSDNEFKQGSVYYELVDGEYVLTEDPTKQQNKTYYSVYTKATESTAISGRTYYTKSGDTYTACNPQPTDLTLTTYYIASNATKLPKGFDLSPYVKVQRIKDNDELEEVSNAYEISNEMGDHIVKEDGSADVKLFISDDLAKGDYWIVIDLYGCDERVKLHKLGNTDTTLELIYDGNPVSFDENNEATTYILWGQPFSKYDLHNLLYLDSYTKAPNSELTITEIFTTENINITNVPYDIGTYTVTITVTPEEGKAVTYKHKLIEKDPFRDNGTILDNYGTLYKDGIVVGSPKLNTPSTGDLTVTDNIIYESFSRDQGEPNYRVKYSFKNVYYSLNDYDYTYEEYNLANQLVTTDSSVTTLYAGFNVVVTSGCDTGTYTFGYVYNNCTFYDNVYYEKVTKDGVTTYFESPDAVAKEGKTYYSYDETTGEYVNAELAEGTVIGEQRKLVFPKLRIIKTPSKNALVNSATFLDQYEALGALATLVYPDGAIVPSSSALAYDAKTEAIYSTLINGSQRISVDPTNREINYEYNNNGTKTNYDETTNDYYIVGTTSEAELERYAPTLTLQDTYSKVFRFASTTRNVQYKGNQDATDASILNAHTDEDFIYLYVPFVGSDESSIVLAVKTTLKDMTYTEVMSQDFKTQYASSSADTNPLLKPLQEGDDPNVDRSYKGKELYDLTFTYGNVTYTVNKNAGSVSKDNESLYDNYAVECENGRFWYVSYVVFSEDFFLNGLGVDAKDSTYNTTTSNWGTRIKFYNVAIIDVSNNIRFILEVDAPKGFSTEYLNNIYVTFAYNKYTSTIMTDSKQLSAYVAYATQLYTESGGTYTPVDAANLNGSTKYYFFDYTSNGYREVEWSTKGTVYDTFVSEYGLQLLPTAYYRFNLDLPNGYVATYKVSKANTYDPVNTQISEDGAYLPPSSIVTQTIKVTITIKEGTTADQSSWGISTSNVSTVVATEETAQ